MFTLTNLKKLFNIFNYFYKKGIWNKLNISIDIKYNNKNKNL